MASAIPRKLLSISRVKSSRVPIVMKVFPLYVEQQMPAVHAVHDAQRLQRDQLVGVLRNRHGADRLRARHRTDRKASTANLEVIPDLQIRRIAVRTRSRKTPMFGIGRVAGAPSANNIEKARLAVSITSSLFMSAVK